MRLSGVLPVLALLLAASAGVGAAAPLLGERCDPEGGGVLYVEADSIGLGEHRVCGYAEPPGDDARLVTTIDCVEYRFLDGEPIAVNPATYTLMLERLEGGLILMQIGEEEMIELEACGF